MDSEKDFWNLNICLPFVAQHDHGSSNCQLLSQNGIVNIIWLFITEKSDTFATMSVEEVILTKVINYIDSESTERRLKGCHNVDIYVNLGAIH